MNVVGYSGNRLSLAHFLGGRSIWGLTGGGQWQLVWGVDSFFRLVCSLWVRLCPVTRGAAVVSPPCSRKGPEICHKEIIIPRFEMMAGLSNQIVDISCGEYKYS